MSKAIVFTKVIRAIFLVLCAVVLFSGSTLRVFADPLPDSELKALTEYAVWVAACSSAASADPTATTTGSSGGVSFDDSQSTDTHNQTSVDDDGTDPSPTGSKDHQGHTSYADGKLGALHTNYFALNPGWAAKNGLALGDVATLTYNGKTIYAVYGDNHTGDTPHAEISVKADLALSGKTNPKQADNLKGVHTTVYPNTHQQLNGSVDQTQIDQIGAQASGGSAPGTASSSSCCQSGGNDPSTDVATPHAGGKYSALVGTGAGFAGDDQGIDFIPSQGGGFDIYAPGSGTITLADQTGHHFDRTNGQAEIIEKLDQKPNAPLSTQFVYFAEIIKIDSKIKVGTHVSKGAVIGHNDQSPGIEVGWARDGKHGFAAPRSSTNYGKSFENWIIGGGGGNTGGGGITTDTSTPQQCCEGGGGSDTVLSGKNNEEKIWNYFKGKGLSDTLVAALLGNFQQESSFNPTEVESDGDSKDPSNISVGWGLVQWTPGHKVLDEAKSNHVSGPIYELSTQLDLVWSEMTVTHFGGFREDKFKNMTDLSTATNYFTSDFEHAGVDGPRVQYAEQALKQFGGKGGGGGGGGSSAPTDGSGDCSATASTSGYQNPLRDVKGLFKRRIDQGVDYGGKGPIYAIGNGTVDFVEHYGEGSGWPGPHGSGGWVSYTLSDGPAKGKIVYFAESCQPVVKHGDITHSNTVICNMDGNSYPWIETGWAASATTDQPLAQLYGGNGCCSTTAGVNFSDLLKSLGAPPGVLTNSPIGRPLPADFPKWK